MTVRGQTTMFELPVPDPEPEPEPGISPLSVQFTVSFRRQPRQKCSVCGHRRVCYAIGLGELVSSTPTCAKCAGIR